MGRVATCASSYVCSRQYCIISPQAISQYVQSYLLGPHLQWWLCSETMKETVPCLELEIGEFSWLHIISFHLLFCGETISLPFNSRERSYINIYMSHVCILVWCMLHVLLHVLLHLDVLSFYHRVPSSAAWSCYISSTIQSIQLHSACMNMKR